MVTENYKLTKTEGQSVWFWTGMHSSCKFMGCPILFC